MRRLPRCSRVERGKAGFLHLFVQGVDLPCAAARLTLG